ncbi:bleomycin hydrolase [Rhodotorula toruloides]|uniref:Cysteine proteinase 1, mitochondrial n=1 Tax=Rhodotorula toruloides TaxID=5286 RepID=A0A511KKX3_RHOTO|nr:bleomycin hydrolase [Rhodotorula toruloides]
MGNSTSTPVIQPSLSEKHTSTTRASSPSSAVDPLAQLSLRGSVTSRASPRVTSENLAAWEGDFASSPKHRLASTVLSKATLTDSLVRRDAQRDTQQVFNVKVNEGGLSITNQKSSGRCWLFSAANLLRIALARKLDLDDFQLSQSYLFFWDSLSKANYFLEQMLDLADSPLDDRVVQHMMTMPENDGGQWSMLDSLITTFGLVPQSIYPESFNSSNTGKLDALLTSKLREYALELRDLHAAAMRTLSELADGKSYGERKALAAQSARKKKEEQMSEVYRILAIALGQPPKPDDTFVWEYYSKKDKKYHRVETTPQKFYQLVGVDVSKALSLVNDPRHEYETLLSVDRLGNVWGGVPVKYVNVDIDVLKNTAIKLLKNDTPVWFGCDVGKFSSSPLGIMSTKLWDLDEGFGTSLAMTKAQRLETGDSAMTHAMLITAVHIDETTGKPTRWRIENSWGPDVGEKGYFVMDDEWFSEYVYQVCADRKYVDSKLVDLFDKGKPIVLPPWDPMGTLA